MRGVSAYGLGLRRYVRTVGLLRAHRWRDRGELVVPEVDDAVRGRGRARRARHRSPVDDGVRLSSLREARAANDDEDLELAPPDDEDGWD